MINTEIFAAYHLKNKSFGTDRHFAKKSLKSSSQRVEKGVAMYYEDVGDAIEKHNTKRLFEATPHVFLELGINFHSRNVCPDCGAPMRPDSGCFFCPVCGYSRC